MYRNGIKRGLDVTIALSMLFVLSIPMLMIAAAIRVMDPGPIIFRQPRVGRSGRAFEFYKFRSMPVSTGDVPSDQLGAVQLTWIGRFIRRTNCDELPQLWNIIKGDMSLVGPRPPLASQTKLIELRRINGALDCRPGLTGWAQVNSFDGMSVEQKATFDEEYARDVTLRRDVWVLLRTIGYVLKPPPKY